MVHIFLPHVRLTGFRAQHIICPNNRIFSTYLGQAHGYLLRLDTGTLSTYHLQGRKEMRKFLQNLSPVTPVFSRPQ